MSPTATHELNTRRARFRRTVDQRLAGLRFAWLRILQVSVAATVAWFIASEVFGHTNPFFAPISVVLVLGLAIERRGSRAYEVALGVALGIGVADLITVFTGTGTWQLILILALAMAVAVLSGGGVLLVNQAAVSAVLVATLATPDLTASLDRFVDALVGGSIALAANALTPVDPVRLVRRHLEPLLARLSGTLVDIADALEHSSREEVMAALERARSLDPAVREMMIAVEAGQETISLSPIRRRSRGRVDQLAAAAEPVDLMIRNTRVLARAAVRAIETEEHVPPAATEAIRDLATAVRSLDRHLGGTPRRSATRDAALRAAATATAALDVTSNLAVSVIIAQVRATATDLLIGLGMTREEAVGEVRSARERMGI